MIFELMTMLILGSLDSTLNIQSLENGQEISLELKSTGCFNYSVKRVDIYGGKEKRIKYTVERDDQSPDFSGKNSRAKVVFSGPLAKGIEDKIELNLAFYREVSEQPGGCTSQSTIKISYKKNGKIIGHEELKDIGCYEGKLQSYFRYPKDLELKKDVEATFIQPGKYRGMENIATVMENVQESEAKN